EVSSLRLESSKARSSTAAVTGARIGGTESAVPRTRFRVITRRPLPPPYRLRRVTPRNPLKRALTLAGVPALLLVVYVALWTGAMHGGYYEQRVSDQIKGLQIENDTLQANLRKLQSPRRILELARGMGMKPAELVEYIG